MFRETVPCSGPVPAVSATVTVELAASPTVESFPNVSCVLMTGCVPNTDPAAAFPGCVANTSLLAAAAFTVSICVADVIAVGDVLAAVIVGVPACVSVYVKLTLLDPGAIDTGLTGVNVAVPVDVLASVTVRVASVVFGLLN